MISKLIMFAATAALVLAAPLRAEDAAKPAAPVATAAADEGSPEADKKPVAESAPPQSPATKADVDTAKSGPANPPAETAKAALPPAPPTLFIDIDLTRQRMTVSEHGNQKYSWAISSGRQGYETPTGKFRPGWMAQTWFSKQYDDAPMPHSIFFNGGIAIHATQATGMLGRPASHGCIRLSPSNAATIYKAVQSHKMAQTRITVHGAPKFPEVPVASRRAPSYQRTATSPYRPGYYAGYQPGYYGYAPAYAQPRYTYPGDRVYSRPVRPTPPGYRAYGSGYGSGYSRYYVD